ncbi:MAG: hypothetical protein U1C74_15940 [Phenylobacterium sp.]|nr:hypothetical protein [Candidatus Omnitrophota bacterium]MDZ4372900.1 hypothetical protein [Phenylobacterium sp.]
MSRSASRVTLPPAWWRAKYAETIRRSDAVGGGRISKLKWQAFRAPIRRRRAVR